MSDKKSNRGMADRERINVDEDYEVQYWTAKFGIGALKLRKTIERAGPMVADAKGALEQ